jgi:anti-sigma B factor antagonist
MSIPARDAGFACMVEHRTRHVVVSLYGELDLVAAPELRRRLLALFSLPVDSVTLDMTGLTFIDSSGLLVLTVTNQAAAEHHINLILEGASASTRRLLELTGMIGLFDLRDGNSDPIDASRQSSAAST